MSIKEKFNLSKKGIAALAFIGGVAAGNALSGTKTTVYEKVNPDNSTKLMRVEMHMAPLDYWKMGFKEIFTRDRDDFEPDGLEPK